MTGIHEKDWPSLIAASVTVIVINTGLYLAGVRNLFAPLAALPIAIGVGLLLNYLLYGHITPYLIKNPGELQ